MVENLLKSLDISQQGDAATAISYEVDAHVLDLVYGRVGYIPILVQEIQQAHTNIVVCGRVGYIPVLVQEIQQAQINLNNINKQFAEANIKVSSTKTSVIFVNNVYETSNVHEQMVIVLNDIHIDIVDYISPTSCADVAFMTTWAEFEWENQVAVNTVIQDEKEFLYHIVN